MIKKNRGKIAILALVLLILNSAIVVAGYLSPSPANREFEITARQYSYNPYRIEVNRGDNVTLRMRSLDVAHGVHRRL